MGNGSTIRGKSRQSILRSKWLYTYLTILKCVDLIDKTIGMQYQLILGTFSRILKKMP